MSDSLSDKSLLKTRVKGNVKFSFFRDSTLWYECEDGWKFPIPVSDTTNSQGSSPLFSANEKGITFMRWIRKQMNADLELELERLASKNKES
jgi:hypothetical protein